MATHWLPTTPGIVSRTADGAYGEHLKTRTPGVRSRAVLAGETFEVWARRIGAQDTPYWRSWYLQDKQSRGLMTPEEQTNYLKKQGWSNSIGAYGEHLKTRIPADWLPPGQGVTVPQGGVGPTSAPGTEYPLLSKRHILGFFGNGSLRDWQGQDWLARMQQLLDNLPAPLKDWLNSMAAPPIAHYPQGYMDWLTNAPAQLNQALSQLPAPLKDWLSNYPRLPQSTIPTPTVEYPAPGRPPAPGEPGYTNPFAWRRKNNGWW